MDVKTALDHCVEDVFLQRAATTSRAYKNGLNVFVRYLAAKKIDLSSPVASLTPDLMISYCSWLLANGFKKKTINVYTCSMDFFVNWLTINGMFEMSFSQSTRYKMAMTTARKKRESSLPRFPKLEDVEKMRNAVREVKYTVGDEKHNDLLRKRNIAIIEFLVSSGCRNNEICIIKIKDMDLKERRGIVTGKGSKQRVIFFSQETVEALRAYWKLRGHEAQEDFVFTRHDRGSKRAGNPRLTTASIRNVVSEVRKVAGLPAGSFTPHYFRHAFAIKMLRETGNLALVQDMLGHADPSATRVYAKIYPDDMRDAYRTVFN